MGPELYPFFISSPENLPKLNKTLDGWTRKKPSYINPIEQKSVSLLNGLEELDKKTFGPSGMPMPRWVAFDCGQWPGLVAGYKDKDGNPLSMYVLLWTPVKGLIFAHNLSSANAFLPNEKHIRGLGFYTKALGLKLSRARRQQGCSQWGAQALKTHIRFGPLKIISAWTPAHSFPATLLYETWLNKKPKFKKIFFSLDSRDHIEMQRIQRAIQQNKKHFWISEIDLQKEASIYKIMEGL